MKIEINMEKFLENYPPEKREEAYKSIMELKEYYDARDKAKRAIVESDNYILWLTEFTKEHPLFSTDDWIYTPNLISKEDNDNVNDLELLFSIIEEYADINYFPLGETQWGGFYLIKYNDVGFKIEVASGQGTVFACQRIEEGIDDFIDFRLIMKNEELESTNEIRSEFAKLEKKIEKLSKKVPDIIIRHELLKIVDNINKRINSDK